MHDSLKQSLYSYLRKSSKVHSGIIYAPFVILAEAFADFSSRVDIETAAVQSSGVITNPIPAEKCVK